jgi:hypothetical protein
MDAILDGVAAQLLRTKLYRTTLRSMTEGILSGLTDVGLVPEGTEPMDEQSVRLLAREAIRDRSRERTALAEKRLLLVEPEAGANFWISDNPVVRFNTFPYGDVALSSPGVEIYCPIAPDLALGLFCPTIAERVAAAVALGDQLEEPLRSQCADLHAAFSTGRPTPLGRGGATAFLNELQVRSSSRFLYGPRDDFDLARRVLAVAPDLRNVTTTVQVGKVGEGTPRRPQMPPGLHLVVYGNRGHHMLAVEAVEDEPPSSSPFPGFDVLTREAAMVGVILRDRPWESVSVFDDGLEVRMMRSIAVEMIEDQGLARLQIRQDL